MLTKANRQQRIESNLLPIWLRKLKHVKSELKGYRWPSAEEGCEQGIALMAMGLNALQNQARAEVSTNDPSRVQTRMSELLKEFAKTDVRWIDRWRKERAGVFSRRD